MAGCTGSLTRTAVAKPDGPGTAARRRGRRGRSPGDGRQPAPRRGAGGGGSPEDASRYDPATVRRYLAAIRVPLYVWSVEKGGAGSPALASWGEVEDVSSLGRLRRAVERLRDDLEVAARRLGRGDAPAAGDLPGAAAAGTIERP